MNNQTLTPGVIFWDFDGTLAHRPDGWSGTLAASLLECLPTCSITRSDLVPLLSQGFPWHTPDIGHPEHSTPDRWWVPVEQLLASACISLGVAAQMASDAAHRTRHRYLGVAGWIVYDDVRPALAALRDRAWRHSIISNHVPELPDLVAALGLAEFFDHIFTSAVVGFEKPHPAIFQAAIQATEPARTAWMVGDSYVADILGAEASGLDAVLVRTHDQRARYCCDGLDAVVDLVCRRA
ncbi:MAG: HAD family hydrolase [Dehalococcoidia bacterium]